MLGVIGGPFPRSVRRAPRSTIPSVRGPHDSEEPGWMRHDPCSRQVAPAAERSECRANPASPGLPNCLVRSGYMKNKFHQIIFVIILVLFSIPVFAGRTESVNAVDSLVFIKAIKRVHKVDMPHAAHGFTKKREHTMELFRRKIAKHRKIKTFRTRRTRLRFR